MNNGPLVSRNSTLCYFFIDSTISELVLAALNFIGGYFNTQPCLKEILFVFYKP